MSTPQLTARSLPVRTPIPSCGLIANVIALRARARSRTLRRPNSPSDTISPGVLRLAVYVLHAATARLEIIDRPHTTGQRRSQLALAIIEEHHRVRTQPHVLICATTSHTVANNQAPTTTGIASLNDDHHPALAGTPPAQHKGSDTSRWRGVDGGRGNEGLVRPPPSWQSTAARATRSDTHVLDTTPPSGRTVGDGRRAVRDHRGPARTNPGKAVSTRARASARSAARLYPFVAANLAC